MSRLRRKSVQRSSLSLSVSRVLSCRWLLPLSLILPLLLGACGPKAPSRAASSTVGPDLPTQKAAVQATITVTHPATQTETSLPTSTPVPTFTITPSPTPLACWKTGGHIETSQIRTELLRLPLEFRIYLPPCYSEQPDRRYPVLYLIHGQSYNDDQWDRLGADETADRLIAKREIAPLIIIMPRDRVWSQPTEDLFGQAVGEALMPWVDENLRTQTGRTYRAVGGLSRGAGWALHLGFSRWELFGSIGMHSLPVFWTDLPSIKGWLEAIPEGQLPRIYMDIGEKDRPQIMKSTIWFENLLTESGIPHEWHLYPGYHEEAYWEAHVEEYLRWYTEGW